jgi:hypothetical protein
MRRAREPVEETLHGEILEKLIERPIGGARLVEKALPDGSGDILELLALHRRASM